MSVPAGWYDDGSGRQRWWDGQQWTEHYAPEGEAQSEGTQDAAGAAPAATDAGEPVATEGGEAPAADTTYAAPETPAYSAPEAHTSTDAPYAAPGAAYSPPGVYPGSAGTAAQQPYGAAGHPAPGQPGTDPNAPKKTPILGYIGLGLAVVGTILACIPPVVAGIGFFLLFAAFVVSIIALFIKFTPKWPGIAGLILSIVGGIAGVVISVFFWIGVANEAYESLPSDFPTSSIDESDEPIEESEEPTEGSTDPAGRPSPEEITAGFLEVMHSADVTDYDDPAVSACIGQEMYDSDLSNETLTTIAGGEDVYEPASEVQHLTEVTSEAIMSCVSG